MSNSKEDGSQDKGSAIWKREVQVRDGYIPPLPPVSQKNQEEKGYVPPPPPPRTNSGKKK